jgi:hypothetical protein
MLQYIVRFAKRFIVLLPALVIVYVSVQNIYPALDDHIPAVLAFLLTYLLAAYGLIPALTRLTRIFHHPNHLPVYSVTPDGYASDPVNIAVIGTKKQFTRAMQQAGWEVAEHHSLANVFKEVISNLFRIPYPTAPMSSLYLMGRKQDLGFEIQIESRVGHRHHVRFWATTYDKGGQLTSSDDIHWIPRKYYKEYRDNQRFLWLGAASKDVGLSVIKHNAQLTHMIHPNTNAERDLIVEQLQIDGGKHLATIQIMKPYTLVNRAWKGYLQTDGKLKVVELPTPKTTKPKS